MRRYQLTAKNTPLWFKTLRVRPHQVCTVRCSWLWSFLTFSIIDGVINIDQGLGMFSPFPSLSMSFGDQTDEQ